MQTGAASRSLLALASRKTFRMPLCGRNLYLPPVSDRRTAPCRRMLGLAPVRQEEQIRQAVHITPTAQTVVAYGDSDQHLTAANNIYHFFDILLYTMIYIDIFR